MVMYKREPYFTIISAIFIVIISYIMAQLLYNILPSSPKIDPCTLYRKVGYIFEQILDVIVAFYRVEFWLNY